MASDSDSGVADRFIIRRATWARILAMFPLTWIIIRLPNMEEAPNPVLAVAWAVLVMAIPALFLASGNYWPRDRALRGLVNDESTRAHRTSALAVGAAFALAFAAVFWLLAWIRPISVQQALATIIDICLGVTLMRFSSLESSALGGEATVGGAEGRG